MADNDNHDAQGEGGSGSADPRVGAGTRVIVHLASARIDKDADNIEALMAETHDLARETLGMARLESYDSPVRDALVRQGSALVGSYTRLMAARERHRKAMKEGS